MNKTILSFGALIVGVIALMFWARSVSEPREPSSALLWPGTEVACLITGHTNLVSHIHPTLRITVDGESEAILANIGVDNTCMSEVHTHDGTGTLHVESVVHGRTFTPDDFFAVWGTSIEREGYQRQVLVNNNEVDYDTYEFKDGNQVEIRYTSQ